MSDVEVASGMAAQLGRFHAELVAGAPRLGWKVAFNDPAAQQRLGLPAPQIAWIDGRNVVANGGAWPLAAGSRVHVEAEVAIRVAHDVPADVSPEVARAAIAGVAPAIEVIDYARPSSPLAALIENAFFHAATVFGQEVAGTLAADTALLGVDKNGAHEAEAIPGRVPADLGEIVVLTARTLARYGERLMEGDRIICGSYIAPFPAAAGDHVVANYGSGLGAVAIHFTATDTAT